VSEDRLRRASSYIMSSGNIYDAVKGVGKSFWNAWEGLLYSLYTQQHMRFHFFAAILVVSLGVILGLPPVEMAILSVLIILVISLEIVNTSIESAMDHVAEKMRPLVKRTKDAAAGAVLVCSFGSVIIAGYLFLPRLVDMFQAEGWLAEYRSDFLSLAAISGATVLFAAVRGGRRVSVAMMLLCSSCCGFAFSHICGSRLHIPSFLVLVSGSIMLLTGIVRSREEKEAKENINLHPRYDLPALKYIVTGEFLGFMLWVLLRFAR
jgi:diacylglycerol kinase